MDIEKLNALTAAANELSQGIEIIRKKPKLRIGKFDIDFENQDGNFRLLPGKPGGLSDRIYAMIENELLLHLASHAGEITEVCRMEDANNG